MRVHETRVYRGPSPYGYRPVVRMTLDLEELEQYPTSKLPGFAGYYLIEADNGGFSSLGLFESAEQGKESELFFESSKLHLFEPESGDSLRRAASS